MHPQVKKALATNNRIDELKATVERARAKGLVRMPNDKAPVQLGSGVSLGGIVVRFVDITPAMAKAWLRGNNRNNRSMKESTVHAYARDMRSGAWLLTHQGVAFNDKDELLDGQHRLAAIELSGVTVTMLVITGLPSEGRSATAEPKAKAVRTMDAVDRGAARSIADILELQHGVVKPRLVSMTAAAVARLCLDGGKFKMTMPALLTILETFKAGISFAVQGAPTTLGLRQSFVLGCVALAFEVKPKETAAFYEKLVTGESLDRKSPVLHVRNWLMSNSGAQIGGGPKALLTAAGALMQHLQAFIENRPMESLATHSKAGLEFFKGQQAQKVKRIASLFAAP